MAKFVPLLLLFVFITIFISTINGLLRPGESIENHSTLRLVQLIHTHGDRTPGQFVHNDPYSIVGHFWPEGIGQLTRIGRNRMYKVGKYFHEVYANFINTYYYQTNVENFIHIRSSSYRRCLESASALTAGLIGGSKNLKDEKNYNYTLNEFIYENLEHSWTPIPIKSFSSKGTDPLLDVDFPCPNLDKIFHEMWHQDHRIKQAEEENRQFFKEISFYAGEKIDTLKAMNLLYQELYIETQTNYHWYKLPYQIWTENYESYAIRRLRELSQIYWTLFYDNFSIQRLIGGELIREINDNFRNYVNGSNRDTKFYLYSTHDGKIVSILQAFGIYNTFLISPGATLIFELHENQTNEDGPNDDHDDGPNDDRFENYFLKFYYFNETFSDNGACEVFPEKFCQNHKQICPLNHYMEKVGKYESVDIRYECGVDKHHLGTKVNLSFVIANGILLVIFIILLNIFAYLNYTIKCR
ncbi:putative acid phosphatase 5 [Dermatophagoides farinae]|uniref:putative acid phosphatase 5 n=1 Tax=Dermatophagoides farinae TaxID=6954 RepID=UPI003F5DC6FD